jgi:hypothetical protein
VEEVKAPTHRNNDAWPEVLKRFATAGESVNAFCRREGLCANSFRRWRERLAGPTTLEAKPSAGAAQPDFVDLGSLGPAPVKAARLELKLDLGGGVMLHLVRG